MESSERKLPYLIGQLLCENLFSVISFCIIVMQNAGIVYYFWNILLSVENLLLKCLFTNCMKVANLKI